MVGTFSSSTYMSELKMHPKELLLIDGELQIEDVRGPKGEGSLEDRMEKLEQEVFNYKKIAEREVDIFHKIVSELIDEHEKETAKLWSDILSLHDTTNKLQAQLYDVRIKTVGAAKARRAALRRGPTAPLRLSFAYIFVPKPKLQDSREASRLSKHREKSSPAESAGKFPPEGEIDAIATVIELDIISIIITIITAISTAAPRHRCNN
ncbi:hypothetical protein QYE76_026488 [Lolium multiflorum]|uniref:Uncharacterized protein n=1 Tax=Lolium multiflorum TaxID=4521 RepID=A0AAD8RHS0_LOLMU|nr:hypothetical protein QYE76_026488 [Lolium multiflorum]